MRSDESNRGLTEGIVLDIDVDEEFFKLIGRHQFTAYEGDVEYDDDGNILNKVVYESHVYKNIIVTNGKNLVLDRLFGLAGPPAAIAGVGVGTDSTAAAVGQTQLNPSVAGSVLIQAPDAGTARSGQTVTIKSTFGTGVANFTWNEAGLFNGTANGTSIMLNRVIIGPFTKSSSVSIIYTTTISQA